VRQVGPACSTSSAHPPSSPIPFCEEGGGGPLEDIREMHRLHICVPAITTHDADPLTQNPSMAKNGGAAGIRRYAPSLHGQGLVVAAGPGGLEAAMMLGAGATRLPWQEKTRGSAAAWRSKDCCRASRPGAAGRYRTGSWRR